MIDRPVQQPRLTVLFGVLGLVILCRILPYVLQSLGISFDVESSTYPWNLSWAFYGAQPFVYGSLLLVACSGFLLRENQSGLRLAIVGFTGATTFFVVSNFGVWISGSHYPHSVAGLIDCYFRAIPFYRNSLISMVVFLPILFSKLGLRTDFRSVST